MGVELKRAHPSSVASGSFTAEDSLDELAQLARTAGLVVVGRAAQRIERVNPATLIGKGKLQEIIASRAETPFDVLLFDEELHPNQQREIEQAFGGASPMSPKIARKVLEIFKKHVPPPKADYNLTERELEVLDLLTQGDDHKQIAEKLFLSPFTIRAHLRNIYDKLHVHSKSQAVAKALQERLLPKK